MLLQTAAVCFPVSGGLTGITGSADPSGQLLSFQAWALSRSSAEMIYEKSPITNELLLMDN